MKTVAKLALAVTLGVMVFAAPAAADTINVTNVTQPYYEVVSVAGFTTEGPNPHTFVGGLERAGQIVLTTNIGNIGTWCVDLFHFISLGGSYAMNTVPLTQDNSGSGPATSNALTTTQIAQIQSLAAYGNANLPTASNKDLFSAAVQAAIWQVEYLTTVTGDTAFNALLATIMGLVPNLPAASGVQLENLNGSDLFTVQNQLYSVPEPGTLALVGSILVALGLLRRRLRLPATPSI